MKNSHTRGLWLLIILFGVIASTLTAGEIKIDYFDSPFHLSKYVAMVTNCTSQPISGFCVVGTHNEQRFILLYAAKGRENLLPGQTCLLKEEPRLSQNTTEGAAIVLSAVIFAEDRKKLNREIKNEIEKKGNNASMFHVSKTAVIFAESANSSEKPPRTLRPLPLYKDINSGTTYSKLCSKFKSERSKDYFRFPFNHIIETVVLEAGGGNIEFVFANPRALVKCSDYERYLGDDENQLFEVRIIFPGAVSMADVRKIADEKYGEAKEDEFCVEFFPQWERPNDNAPVIVRKIVQSQYPAHIYLRDDYSAYLYGGTVPSSVKILPLSSSFQKNIFEILAQDRFPLDWDQVDSKKMILQQEKESIPVSLIVRDQARWDALLAAKDRLETDEKKRLDMLARLIEMLQKKRAKDSLDF